MDDERLLEPCEHDAALFAGPDAEFVFVGHNTVLVRSATTTALVDPLLAARSVHNPLGYQPLQLRELGSPDVVVITHAHPDHFDPASLLRLARTTTLVVPFLERETWLSVDLARRARELGFDDVRALRWSEHTTVGDLRITAYPFYGEQPTDSTWLHAEVRNQGCTYRIDTPTSSAAFLADSGRDHLGDAARMAIDARRADGAVDVVFCGYRGWLTYPVQLLVSSVARYFLFVPPDLWQCRMTMMATADMALDIAERWGAKIVVPYADGGAPWHWRLGLGPRLDDLDSELPGFDPFPERVVDAARRRATAGPGQSITSPASVAVLRPGQGLRVEGRVEVVEVDEHRWPYPATHDVVSGAGMTVAIQVTEPDGESRRLAVPAILDIGRDPIGLQLRDLSVSRRHVRLEPHGNDRLLVTDLGSSHGSYIDGIRLDGPAWLLPGSVLTIGETRIELLGTAPPPPPTGPAMSTLADDGVEVAFVPGTPAERYARSTLSAARKARRRLAGFGTEALGTTVRIYLVGPFPDPADPSKLVTQGSVIDASSGQIWMAVSPEAPPDEPTRALAVVFAAALPAAEALAWLVEGYALYVSDIGDVDGSLRGLPLPDIADADEQLRAAMCASFVRNLIRRRDAASIRHVLAEATPEDLDGAFQRHFGAPLRDLGASWRADLSEPAGSATGALGHFVRLSWRYLRPHRRRQAEIFLWMGVGLAFTVVLPFATRQLFDVVLPSREMGKVFGLLGLLLAAFAVSLLAGLRRSYVSGYVSGALVRDLRNEMFDRLQYLPTSWYRSTTQGDVLTRLFSDVTLVEDGLSSTLREGIFQMLSMVVTAAILLRLNLSLAAIVLVGTPLVALVYRRMGAGARQRSTIVQEQTGALMNVAAENHTAEQVVKVYGLQRREQGRFGAVGEQLFRSERSLALFSGIFGLLVNSIVTLLRITVLAVGSWMVINERMTLGTLVAFLGVMGELIGPVTTLTTIGQNLQSASGALERIEEILHTPGVAGDQGAVAGPLRRDLRLVSVGFGYGNGPRVLDDVDLTIHRGERVAVVGPSGSGKSTVLRLLMRLHDPDEGSILYDGTEVRQLTSASIRDHMGAVFQDSFLFDGTVAENIALGNPAAVDADIEAAANAAELDQVLAELPGGYHAQVGPGGANLSGGQRQRVAIARALVRNPDVLLLDEATSALDPQTERRLVETLDRVSQGRTTVAITHRLGSVVGYDRIVVLDRGRIVEIGQHEDLLAAGGLYARLWAEQNGTLPPADDPLLASALRRLPFLTDVADGVLLDVVRHLSPYRLAAGESMQESEDAAVIVVSGRALVRTAALGGPAEVVELGPGDAFGVSAMLGDPSNSELHALERVELRALTRPILDALARDIPSVAHALRQGSTEPGPHAPSGATRMARLTLVGAAGVAPARRATTARATIPSSRARERTPMAGSAIETLLRNAVLACGANAGWIVARAPDGLQVVAYCGPEDPDRYLGAVFAADEAGTVGFAAASDQPIAVRTRPGDALITQGPMSLLATPPQCYAAVPCSDEHGVIGALEVVDKQAASTFDIDDVELLALLGDIAAAMLREREQHAFDNEPGSLARLAEERPGLHRALVGLIDALGDA